MTMTINGSGTITGLSVGGLPNATVTSPLLAAGAARANFGAGAVLQVLQVVKTDIFSSSANGFVDVTGLTLNITPSSTSNKILVICTVSGGASGSSLLWNLVRNGTNIAQSTAVTAASTSSNAYPSSYQFLPSPITFLDSPASTSAVTYKIQMNANNATCYVNARANDNYYGGISQITLMEIAQ